HSVLIFAVSVDHATKIKETLERLTHLECGLVTGDTPSGEPDRILRRFKGQRAVASLLVLPHCCNNPLPLVASVDKPTNGRQLIEGEANCGEAARFPIRKVLSCVKSAEKNSTGLSDILLTKNHIPFQKISTMKKQTIRGIQRHVR
ncbi:MAG: hypothetical protein LBG58_04120, partial [Planctomycetaceae bacterium]|nr:hypothetical protein [Planctomycetaceae bacterium]